jgi:glycolate oxidase FAD binding subunit
VTTDTLVALAAQSHAPVRAGREDDELDGVCPRVVAEPSTAEAVSALLALASTEQLAVAIQGGGTKQTWGRTARPVDLLLSTAALDRVVAHRHGDLTATVEAGATLASVNAAFAPHAQWLPLDPSWPTRATVGGIVATNDSGPRRYRHGAPRDLIIGVTIVRADGELAKAGGIVVKNVAGYDLSRLMTGSFGSLAVIVSVTFKLVPVAPASRTVVVELDAIEEMAPIVADLLGSPLTPSAFELEWPPARLLIRFESVESAVEQQARAASELIHGRRAPKSVATTVGPDETEVWARHADRWDESGTLLKVSTLTDAVVPTLSWLSTACQACDVRMSAQGRAGLGVFDVRLDGVVAQQAKLIAELRDRFSAGEGTAVVRRGTSAIREAIDPWGPIGDGLRVMQSIKKQFDPHGLLNAGRGPV